MGIVRNFEGLLAARLFLGLAGIVHSHHHFTLRIAEQ